MSERSTGARAGAHPCATSGIGARVGRPFRKANTIGRSWRRSVDAAVAQRVRGEPRPLRSEWAFCVLLEPYAPSHIQAALLSVNFHAVRGACVRDSEFSASMLTRMTGTAHVDSSRRQVPHH